MGILSKTRVVIVGGGIAGIKAALELQANQIDYLIIEAKGRLGGRLRTVAGENYKYDLGASWFHETLDNKLFDEEVLLARENGQTAFYYDDALPKIINEKGIVSPSLKLQAIGNEIHKFVELESYKDLAKDDSVYDVVVRYLKQRKHLLSHEQIANALEYVRSLELWHGIDIQRLSAKYASIDNAGRDALALHYDRVLKRHTDQLDLGKVRLNTVVGSIKKVGNGKKVEVTTTDDEVFEADYTIVTVPQSILQSKKGEKGHIDFEPALPSRLQESLNHVHFGALGKVVLEFDEPFWPTDSERILSLGTSPEGFLESILNDSETPKLPIDGPIPQTWEYPVLFLNLATTVHQPTLVCLTQSPVTDYLERNPSTAWDYLKPIVSKFSNISTESELPTPKNVIVTDWTTDPYQRGSYSACFPGDDPLAPIIEFEQGFGNIRFAGEHTILEGAGCVHGAWESGKREADFIIETTLNN